MKIRWIPWSSNISDWKIWEPLKSHDIHRFQADHPLGPMDRVPRFRPLGVFEKMSKTPYCPFMVLFLQSSYFHLHILHNKLKCLELFVIVSCQSSAQLPSFRFRNGARSKALLAATEWLRRHQGAMGYIATVLGSLEARHSDGLRRAEAQMPKTKHELNAGRPKSGGL